MGHSDWSCLHPRTYSVLALLVRWLELWQRAWEQIYWFYFSSLDLANERPKYLSTPERWERMICASLLGVSCLQNASEGCSKQHHTMMTAPLRTLWSANWLP
jgi:hypothetical protein